MVRDVRGRIPVFAVIAVALSAAAPPSASADRFLTPASADFGQLASGMTSPPRAFTLRVTCMIDPMTGNCTGVFDPTIPDVSATGDYTQTNDCPEPGDVMPFMPGDSLAGTTCTINVRFSPSGTGVRSGTLRAGGRTAALTGRGPDPPVVVTSLPQTQTPPPPGPTRKKCKKPKKRAAVTAKKCRKKRR